MAVDFKLPELGEGVESGTVSKVMVSKGDTVSVDQPVLETEVHVGEGDALKIGAKILSVTESGETPEEAEKKEKKKKNDKEEDKPEAEEKKKKKEEKPKAEEKNEKQAEEARAKEEEKEEEKEAEGDGRKDNRRKDKEKADEAEEGPARRRDEREAGKTYEHGKEPVPAAPHVRGFAREIGVDIHDVKGSGPGGRISIEDVKAHSKDMHRSARQAGGPTLGIEPQPLPDFTRWGEVERVEMNSVRRRTAENLGRAWATIPHVTQHEKVDITELEAMRKRYGKRVEEAGGKLTVTAILTKICAAALKKFPRFNASLDMESGELLYKHYYNIGLAVDTDRGLLVPVLRDADQKNLTEISAEINDLAERARNRKSAIEELRGACFTISNLGGIGGTFFSPIVNPPEVAILGVSRAVMEPVYQEDGSFEPRLMLPLSLSYDHRVIDGADGARFIVYLREVLEQPFLLFLDM